MRSRISTGEIPDGSVWEIGRISAKKLNLLLERGLTNITDVPADDADLKLNDAQVRQVRAATLGEPIIHNERNCGDARYARVSALLF